MRKIHFLIFIFLLVEISFAQTRKVSGIVLDSSNQIIPGVTVVNLNSHKSFAIKFDGVYEIEATPTDSLEFFFIGMKTQRVKADKEKIDVVLQESDVILEEVLPYEGPPTRQLNNYLPLNKKNILNRTFIATLEANICKGDFSSSFFRELTFEKDVVIVADFYTRSNAIPDFRFYTKYEKYPYKVVKGKIVIDCPDKESLKLKEHLRIVNRKQIIESSKGQIFTEFVFDVRGKVYEGCNGLSCEKTVNGGFTSSDCLKFGFGDRYVHITTYQKNYDSNKETKTDGVTKSYLYERIGNKVIINGFVYPTVYVDTNQLYITGFNNENLTFKRIH
jgi:hypothetical protein